MKFGFSLKFRVVALFATLVSCAALPVHAPVSAQTAAPPTAATVPPEVTLPDTSAGQQMGAWLAAINSGRKETLQRFVATGFAASPDGSLPVDSITKNQWEIYSSTGGFTVHKVLASTPERLTVAVRAKRTEYWSLLDMGVRAAAPHPIVSIGFRNTEAPADILPHKRLTDAEIRENADRLISRLVTEDAFSGVILIARDGKPIYQRAVGLASRAWNVPNRTDTRFNLGSIGKMFTAVSIAQLVEQGKLSYDDTLAKAYPEYPNKEIANQITVRQLLTHTSGISDGNKSLESLFRQGFRTVKEYLAGAASDTLKFTPGSHLEYSNYGYLLLGAIIEKASGQDYFTYVREHIYKPAGMNDTDNFDLDTEPKNLATGYMDAPGGRRSNTFMLPVRGLPYGLGYSTAEDLVRFSTALRAGKLLKPETLADVWTGRVNYSEYGSKYGYGCIVKTYNGTRIVGHGGGWVGITNKFDMYPDLGYTVVILNNIDSYPNPVAFCLRAWLTQGSTNQTP